MLRNGLETLNWTETYSRVYQGIPIVKKPTPNLSPEIGDQIAAQSLKLLAPPWRRV
jgi:hypothetical protein